VVVRLPKPKVAFEMETAADAAHRVATGLSRGAMILGPPGVAKTETIAAVYRETGVIIKKIPGATLGGLRAAFMDDPDGHYWLDDFDHWMKDQETVNFLKQVLLQQMIGKANALTGFNEADLVQSNNRVIISSNADPEALRPQARAHLLALRDRCKVICISHDPLDLLNYLGWWIVEKDYYGTDMCRAEAAVEGLNRRLSLREIQDCLNFLYRHAWRQPLSLRRCREIAVERVLHPDDWDQRLQFSLFATPRRTDVPPEPPTMFGQNERHGLQWRPTGFERRQANRLAKQTAEQAAVTSERPSETVVDEANARDVDKPQPRPASIPQPRLEADPLPLAGAYSQLPTFGNSGSMLVCANGGIIPGRSWMQLEIAPPPAGLTDSDDLPEVPEEPTSVLGDLWLMGRHRVLVGDSRDPAAVARLMDGAKADASVTSPPYLQQRDYNENIIIDWDGLMRGVFGILPVKEDAQILVNLGLVHRKGVCLRYWEPWITWMGEQGWRLFGWYMWDKLHGLPGDWVGRLAPSHENVFHFNRIAKTVRKTEEKRPVSIGIGRYGIRNKDGSTPKTNNPDAGRQTHKIGDSVFRVGRHNTGGIEHEHPAIFPFKFAVQMMAPWSDPGDLLYEPFTGSGTVIIAAESAGRSCYGMEVVPRYADLTVLRFQAFTGKQAVLDGDGRTFAAIRAERIARRFVR
jgi:DNA modification methylase